MFSLKSVDFNKKKKTNLNANSSRIKEAYEPAGINVPQVLHKRKTVSWNDLEQMNFRGISGALNRLVNKEGGALERGAEVGGDGEREQVKSWDIFLYLKETISRHDSLAIWRRYPCQQMALVDQLSKVTFKEVKYTKTSH